MASAVPPPAYAIETTFGALPPGQYTLLVRARDRVSGQIGPPFQAGFVVANGSIRALGPIGLATLAGLLLVLGPGRRR